ncbi:hypothetical protein [Methanobrevibacter cuticularis]|uniref:hypothetical protein n=1 Tax=Methanobrevibacter cuticularis TaxID=47311 RepID=UPI000832F79E|nr:hypothetical protein [Methanobrevibacter cuticularis]
MSSEYFIYLFEYENAEKRISINKIFNCDQEMPLCFKLLFSEVIGTISYSKSVNNKNIAIISNFRSGIQSLNSFLSYCNKENLLEKELLEKNIEETFEELFHELLVYSNFSFKKEDNDQIQGNIAILDKKISDNHFKNILNSFYENRNTSVNTYDIKGIDPILHEIITIEDKIDEYIEEIKHINEDIKELLSSTIYYDCSVFNTEEYDIESTFLEYINEEANYLTEEVKKQLFQLELEKIAIIF